MTIARPSTPPRGWNSWDSYGTAVTEADVLANARFMAEHLLGSGYDTIVVDIQWYEALASSGGYNDADATDIVLDAFGRPQPAPGRFPSAANGAGFRPLADAVHALGLRFGLHIMRGIPRRAVRERLPILGTNVTADAAADLRPESACTWNSDNHALDHDGHPNAARAYYASLGELFDEWTVDFVKADDMLWPYHARDIELLSAALEASEREIALSLSPGVDVSVHRAEHLARHATMWRVSDDLWDRWADVEDQFQRMARWAPLTRDGAFADADMLPLGHIGISAERGDDRVSLLTPDEQRTLMTLWSISRSPLMMGGDLPTSDAAAVELLTNARVLEVDARSSSPREALREHGFVVWTAELDGSPLAAVFAVGDEPLSRSFTLASLGVEDAASATELWTGDVIPVTDASIEVSAPVHGALLLRFS